MIQSLVLRNVLSFGPEKTEVGLNSLNVLIGPNGSGKSNLIEIIGLLQSAPSDLPLPVRRGGGTPNWIWKGEGAGEIASVEAIVRYPDGADDLRYRLAFSEEGQQFHLEDERLEYARPEPGKDEPYFFYHFRHNHPIINSKGEKRGLQRDSVDPQQSILSQRKDPDQFPEIFWLSEMLNGIRIYREWTFGRKARLRQPQVTDAPNDFLSEDCLNLGLVLNRIKSHPKSKAKILGYLQEFYEGISDFNIIVEGGTAQLFLQEQDVVIPASRLSDGTLRFLCLLAILCHPNLPPLICLEEPELGMHADMMPVLADLLKEASQRSQIIVTTHSDGLVDEMSDQPESVLVCEKHEGQSRMRRLDGKGLRSWLEKYSLGQLWRKGEIGGNRW